MVLSLPLCTNFKSASAFVSAHPQYFVKHQNTSGKRFRGICFHSSTNRWRARIKICGKSTHLGYFDTKVEAALEYDCAALKHHNQRAQTNFLGLASLSAKQPTPSTTSVKTEAPPACDRPQAAQKATLSADAMLANTDPLPFHPIEALAEKEEELETNYFSDEVCSLFSDTWFSEDDTEMAVVRDPLHEYSDVPPFFETYVASTPKRMFEDHFLDLVPQQKRVKVETVDKSTLLSTAKPSTTTAAAAPPSKKPKNKVSKHHGVCWYRRTNRWMVQIKLGGRRRHVGYFINEDDAIRAYQQAALEYSQ